MKRRLLIIAIFLLLGAVVNVAVAWALALRVEFNIHTAQVTRVGSGWHPGQVVESPAVPPYLVILWTGPGAIRIISAGKGSARARIRRVVPPWSLFHTSRPETLVVEDGRGWPALSVRCVFVWGPNGFSVTDGFELPPFKPGGHTCDLRALPYRPIWPGFAINTTFYAALLWLLIPGPFVLRRFLRLKRGLCPKCAYPMGESSVCTECGGALPRHQQGAAQRKRLSAARRGVHSSAHSEAIL